MIQIYNDGAHLLIVFGTKGDRISKVSLNLTYDGEYILINDQKYKYSDVTIPSSTSAQNLASIIDGYLES